MTHDIDRAALLARLEASRQRLPFENKGAVLRHFDDGNPVHPAKRLGDRLRSLLTAPTPTGLTPPDLHRVVRAQYLEQVLGGPGDWVGEITKIAGFVGGATDIRGPEDSEWDEIADLGRGLYVLEGEPLPAEWRHPRERAVAAALANLVSRGIVPALINIELELDDALLRDATRQIQSLLDQIGVRGAVRRVMRDLAGQGTWGDLYLAGRRPSIERREQSAPLSFLLQLALRAPNHGEDSNADQSFTDALALAKDLAGVLDLEPFSQFEGLFARHNHIVEHLRDLAIFDAMYSLRQWRPSDCRTILQGFFQGVDQGTLKAVNGWDIDDALSLLDAVFALSKSDPSTFSRTELEAAGLQGAVSHSLLSSFAHRAGQVNTGFDLPLAQPDAMFRPLIEVGPDTYMLVARSLAGPAFYEAIQAGVRRALGKKAADQLAGDGTERVATHLFRQVGIEPEIVNELYDMPGAGDGECDLVYVNSAAICFVETKAKALTRATMAGESGAALLDLAGGMFAGQLQALRHERLLRERRQLDFQSGARLPWNDRQIINMSLTLLDHGALQDRTLLRMFYGTLMNAHFTPAPDFKNAAQVAKLNTIIGKAREDVSRLQEFGHDPLRKTGRTASVNIGLLAIMLEDAQHEAQDGDVLSAFLRRATAAVTYSLLNPLAEYYFDKQAR